MDTQLPRTAPATELIFLDEPTTGFDPAPRQSTWDLIADLRDLGETIFLTTHYMGEAERLADRIAVIAAGQVVAEGPQGWANATQKTPSLASPSGRPSMSRVGDPCTPIRAAPSPLPTTWRLIRTHCRPATSCASRCSGTVARPISLGELRVN